MNRLLSAMMAVAVTIAVLAGLSMRESEAAKPDGGKPTIVAAFYPLAYAAEQVAGDSADVVNLTPPGVEPHDLELTPDQVAQISEADLVLYIPGFMPALDEAIAQQAPRTSMDVTEGLTMLADPEHDGASDPHIWLNPANLGTIGDGVAERLSAEPRLDSAALAAGANQLSQSMADLSAEYERGLATCRSRDLVVSHEAFGYLADAFKLTQVGISGLSPDAEPSPARMKEVADLVAANQVTTIYYETLVDPKVAQTLADETGATTAVLDPIEGLPPNSSQDYASLMRANLTTLRAGQGCS